MWFFSFYAYFSNIHQDSARTTILLLDEPGTSLHASAQSDVLSFVEEKLSPKHQVIYTTHSPFLIDPQRIDRVRMVQDLDGQGTTVGADGYQLDSETVFPLQAALSYELAQPLVTGPHCLLTGWPSDLIYLQLLEPGLPGGRAFHARPLGGSSRRWAAPTRYPRSSACPGRPS